MSDYDTYVAGKIIEAKPSGFECGDLNPALFPYQRDVVRSPPLLTVRSHQAIIEPSYQIAATTL